jgi:glycosyltransferase involved in cell wall biosynthesis
MHRPAPRDGTGGVRVGIDYRPALLGKTGIGRYTEGLVGGLIETGRADSLRLYGVFLSAGRIPETAVPDGIRLLRRPIPGRLADGLGRLGLTVDRAVGGCEIWHHTDFVVPRARCPAVMTLHDVVFLRDARFHGAERTENLTRVLERARDRCRLFIVPSRAAARDAEELAGLPSDRIRVVRHGIDPRGMLAAAPVRRDRPYVLAVGSLEPRKNLPRLIDAFGRIAAENADLELLVAGPSHHEPGRVEEARAGSPAADRIHLLGHVTDATLGGLYRGAAALAYVSLVEGFGLPVLEGMAAGVPVVTSRGTAMEETAGAAAVLVDPEDTASIEGGLRSALTDDDQRRRLAREGPERAALFTWARAARETWAAYEEAAGR